MPATIRFGGALLGIAVALQVSAAAASPASRESGVLSMSCVGPWGLRNCVVHWREAPRDPHVVHAQQWRNESEMQAAEARDRQWQERCRPSIRYDRYGVARYVYARRGCEFGRAQD